MELNIIENDNEQTEHIYEDFEFDTNAENTYLTDDKNLAYYAIAEVIYGGFNELYYNKNYTVGEIKRIYDYYKLHEIKGLKKTDLIHAIIIFEQDITNSKIVKRRHQLWSYLYELKQDPFMKRYVIY